uniref:Transmembrane protein n=1 Tax=Aegilops tauschii subsp. strangulata TaxID=200361 RepID=A0A452Y730_AEGTS
MDSNEPKKCLKTNVNDASSLASKVVFFLIFINCVHYLNVLLVGLEQQC